MRQWYYSEYGEKKGPVRELDLVDRIRHEELPPDALIWTEGMDDWVEIRNAHVDHLSSTNPITFASGERHTYGGIGRGVYFACILGMTLITWPILTFLAEGYISFLAILAMYSIVSMVPAFFRLQNMGCSGLLVFLVLIPGINLFVGAYCMMAPEGFADSGKLDLPGKIVAGILIALGAWKIMGLIAIW